MKKQVTFDDKKALSVVIRYRVGSRVQKEVAKKGGLDPTTMSQFASGNRYPRSANMKKLAVALDCSVPTLKEAVAKVLSIDESGNDEAAMLRALDQHFLGVEGDAVLKVDRIQDPTLKSLVKNLMKAVTELVSYLAITWRARTE